MALISVHFARALSWVVQSQRSMPFDIAALAQPRHGIPDSEVVFLKIEIVWIFASNNFSRR
jgi:hypothetical protein